MADFIFNVALGKFAYYATLPLVDDSMIVVPIGAGAVSDATLKDLDFLNNITSAVTEQTTLGRKTLSTVTSTVSDASDNVTVDADDVTWTSTAGSAITDLIVCYKPTAASADTAVIPLFCLDCAMTPDGTNFTAQINASGLATAT